MSEEEFAICPDCNTGRFSLVVAGKHFCNHCELDEANAYRTYIPNMYAILLPKLRGVAFRHGYALMIHGSMMRDFDLLACPWVENAKPADALAAAIMEACGGYMIEPREGSDPTKMPHGRLAWSIHLGGHLYLDLSVMPTAKQQKGGA